MNIFEELDDLLILILLFGIVGIAIYAGAKLSSAFGGSGGSGSGAPGAPGLPGPAYQPIGTSSVDWLNVFDPVWWAAKLGVNLGSNTGTAATGTAAQPAEPAGSDGGLLDMVAPDQATQSLLNYIRGDSGQQ